MDVELLISDNGSTDGTIQEVERVLSAATAWKGTVRVFHQCDNLGAFGNLTFLLRAARSPYAHILCADDTFQGCDALMTIRDAIQDYPDVGIFGFDNDTQHSKGAHWREIRREFGSGPIDGLSATVFYFCFGCYLGGLSNVTVNRRRFGGQDGEYFDSTFRYYGDIEFYSRAAMAGESVLLVDYQLTWRRVHDCSISATGNLANLTTPEAIGIAERLYLDLSRKRFPRGLMRFLATWHATQFYHRAFGDLLRGRGGLAWRRVVAANQGAVACWIPSSTALLSLVIWPKLIRRGVHNRVEAMIARRLIRERRTLETTS